MRRRKNLALLLSLALLLGMLPALAAPAAAVTSLIQNETQFESALITAVDGKRLALQNDVTLSTNYTINYSVTIDLAGHSLTQAENSSVTLTVASGKTLKVVSIADGTVSTNTDTRGTLTVDALKFDGANLVLNNVDATAAVGNNAWTPSTSTLSMTDASLDAHNGFLLNGPMLTMTRSTLTLPSSEQDGYTFAGDDIAINMDDTSMIVIGYRDNYTERYLDMGYSFTQNDYYFKLKDAVDPYVPASITTGGYQGASYNTTPPYIVFNLPSVQATDPVGMDSTNKTFTLRDYNHTLTVNGADFQYTQNGSTKTVTPAEGATSASAAVKAGAAVSLTAPSTEATAPRRFKDFRVDTYNVALDANNAFTMPGADVTITARFEGNLTYKSNYPASLNMDPATDVVDTVFENEPVGSLRAADTFAAPDHYSFKEWNTKADGTGSGYGAGTQPTGEQGRYTTVFAAVPATLYGQWELASYAIDYHLGGGAWAENYDAPATYTYGTGATLPTAENVALTGSSFSGWYDNKNLEGDPVTAIPADAAGAKEYWAKWTENPPETVNVTYKAGYGSGGEDYTQTVEIGVPTALSNNQFTREGFAFDGWLDAQGNAYTDGQTVTLQSATVLTARWRVSEVCLWFWCGDGGAEAEEPTSWPNPIVTGFSWLEVAEADCPYALPAPEEIGFVPAAEGAEFLYWSCVDEDGAELGRFDIGDGLGFDELLGLGYWWDEEEFDVDFDAVWSAPEAVTVTYDPGELGGDPYTVTADANAVIRLPEPAEAFSIPSNWSFLGWQRGETTYAAGDSYTVTNDVTFTALWRTGASYVSDGGSASYAITVAETVNGTAKASASSAAAGADIKIAVTPDKGFRVESVTVTAADGTVIAVTDHADGTCSFKMPAKAVEIKVKFLPDAASLFESFSDLDPEAWYHDGVRFVLETGLMEGYGDGTFGPNDFASRAMIVTILYRLEGEPVIRSDMPFSDVTESDWYARAVSWAESLGIVNGFEDGTFRPNDPVTREQLAAMLYRYAQYKGRGFRGLWSFRLDFPDAADVSDWADEAMHWMVMQGVINGMDGKLNPQGKATRAMLATMLMRFCTGPAAE